MGKPPGQGRIGSGSPKRKMRVKLGVAGHLLPCRSRTRRGENEGEKDNIKIKSEIALGCLLIEGRGMKTGGAVISSLVL